MKVIASVLVFATAAASFAAEKKAVLRQGERVVLACLGMIGSEKPARIEKAERILAAQEKQDFLRPLATALTCNPPSLRIYAAGRLATLGDERAARPLLHKLVREPKAEVRAAFAGALRRMGARDAVRILGRALWSRNPTTVRNAAEALGELGDEAAIPYVIRKWSGRSGDFPRVYFTQVNQRSYIQDFDVEVAATSFIADPIIGISQEGLVQPVKIIGTEQTFTDVYHATLVKLTGRDLGKKVGAWRKAYPQSLSAKSRVAVR